MAAQKLTTFKLTQSDGAMSRIIYVHARDLRLATAICVWRLTGLGFLSPYAHGVLPGLFAFPACLGDIAVGISAPWIVLGLIRHP